jgi:hypothetical protein
MKTVLYNDGVHGNLVSTFLRDHATVDEQGVARAADQRRFAKEIAVAPLIDWTEVVTLGANNASEIWATGYDTDGTTPLAVFLDWNLRTIKIYRGTAMALYRSITITGTTPDWDISGAAVPGTAHEP